MDYQAIVIATITAVSGFAAGKGFDKLIDFLTKRKEMDQIARAKELEAEQFAKDKAQLTEERIQDAAAKQSASFIAELRGEVHALRDQLNAASLKHRAEIMEAATRYEKQLLELNSKHEKCLIECAQRDVRIAEMGIEIRQLQAQLAHLSTGGGQAIVTVDDEGVILAWNQEATEVFGWTSGEALSKRISDLIVPPEHVETHEAAFARWKEEDRPPRGVPLIFRGRNKWGEQFPIDVSLTGWKSQVGHWHVTATMRKRADRFE